ncbi:MAG: hypothetical protein ABI707_19750 [Ferruginibacter sp.]
MNKFYTRMDGWIILSTEKNSLLPTHIEMFPKLVLLQFPYSTIIYPGPMEVQLN